MSNWDHKWLKASYIKKLRHLLGQGVSCVCRWCRSDLAGLQPTLSASWSTKATGSLSRHEQQLSSHRRLTLPWLQPCGWMYTHSPTNAFLRAVLLLCRSPAGRGILQAAPAARMLHSHQSHKSLTTLQYHHLHSQSVTHWHFFWNDAEWGYKVHTFAPWASDSSHWALGRLVLCENTRI